MSYKLISQPFLLYETTAMLYKFVNGISCRSALSLHLAEAEEAERSIRQADELQMILEDTCRELSPADPALQHFFSSVSTGDHQEGTCLAYLMIFSFFTLKHSDFHKNVEDIRENWKILQKKGAWIQGYSLMSLHFSFGDGCPGDFLDQVCRLALPAEFQISLCQALRNFNRTLDELAALLYPISLRLEQNLRRISWIWEEKVEYWKKASPLDYVSATAGQPIFQDDRETVSVAIFLMIHNFLLVKKSESVPGRSYLYIGCGASVHSRRRSEQLTCDMMSAALKSFSDRKRLDILCRLSHSRAYSFELAEAMGIDPSNMSRSLSLLCSYGFLKQRKEAQKIFYETDKDAVRHFLRQLEHFILD